MWDLIRGLFSATTKKTPAARRARPRLEALEERDCPAVATWSAGAAGNWNVAGNWTWDVGGMGANYPGDSAMRATDEVVFNGGSNKTCTLGAAATLNPLASLKMQAGAGTVTLSRDVTLTSAGGGFTLDAGTLSIGSGKYLHQTATGGSLWSGTTVTGDGTIDYTGGINGWAGGASSMGCNVTVSSSASVVLTSLDGNVAMNGSGNTIDVYGSAKILLLQDVSAANAFSKGGITGGASHGITVRGSAGMERGTSSHDAGGAVLVDVPVLIESDAYLSVFYATSPKELTEVKFNSADSGTGLSLYVIQNGQITQESSTVIRATNGLTLDGNGAIYTAAVEAGETTGMIGNLTVTNGTLSIETAGTPTTFSISGNLKLDTDSALHSMWSSTDICGINVSGSAYIAGILTMSTQPGQNDPAQNTYKTLIIANSYDGSHKAFSSMSWADDGMATVTSTIAGDDFKIKWN